ncbi:hypothetical protein ACIPZG_23200 [Pseudomonas sp. NPDC089395]|uniref:hypothetical protein n=1 Tax=Pseudomonas sp. NPDC089395 TaxID=3364460 RepID=UPI003804CAE1
MKQYLHRRSTRELCEEMAKLNDTITIAKFKLKELEAECDRRLQQQLSIIQDAETVQ